MNARTRIERARYDAAVATLHEQLDLNRDAIAHLLDKYPRHHVPRHIQAMLIQIRRDQWRISQALTRVSRRDYDIDTSPGPVDEALAILWRYTHETKDGQPQ